MINNLKEFNETINNLVEKDITLECKCERCGKTFDVIKRHDRNPAWNRVYYKLKNLDPENDEMLCDTCRRTDAFRKTQKAKGEEKLKEEQIIKTQKRNEFYQNKYKEDSSIVYSNWGDLYKAWKGGKKGASFNCKVCGKPIVLKNRGAFNQYMYRHNENNALYCKGCQITKTKLENSADRMQTDKDKLLNCTFVKGQEWKGANYEDENGENVHRRFRIKYKFKCNLCNKIFEESFPCGDEHPIMCPDCYPDPLTTSSSDEKELYAFINDNYKGKILKNDRSVVYPQELDLYLPDLKLAFEYDGIYWHSDRMKDKNYHLNKTKACENKGIRLIHIFGDEWKSNKDIIKGLIKEALGLYDRSIDVNECVVKDVSKNEEIKFLEENHYLGFHASTMAKGLYHNNELVSLISFIKPNLNKNYDWELVRFTNKLGYKIEGSFDKLIKEKPEGKILIYLDRSKFTGDFYREKGFKELKILYPSYFYVKHNKRYSWRNFPKASLIKDHPEYSDLTEYQIMDKLGYFRIWDCGNWKFEID